MIVLVLLCKWLLMSSTNANTHRLYTTTDFDQQSDTFDCIEDLIMLRRPYKTGVSAEFSLLHFCRRLVKTNENFVFSSLNISDLESRGHQVISFLHLRLWNISIRQMLDWNAPMDTIEDYAQGALDGIFINCSDPWFGTRCQYTFNDTDRLYHIANFRISSRRINDDILSYTNGSCYVKIECQSTICLDWREICDGKWDCSNGIDERDCYMLEANQCNPLTEYRCADGLCIPREMYLDRITDCMDQSDETIGKLPDEYCYKQMNSKICEDHKCMKMQFSCGDGHCADDIDKQVCASKRDQLYLSKVLLQSTLNKHIFFGHVTLEYKDQGSTIYICYNTSLCPYLSNAQNVSSRTCQTLSNLTNRLVYEDTNEMLADIRYHMLHACSLPSFPSAIQCNTKNNLFQCTDGRCISIHRLLDGRKDCTQGQDELSNETCILNLPDRYKCDNGQRCISTTLILDQHMHCRDGTDELIPKDLYYYPYLDHHRILSGFKPLFNISFQDVCNNVIDRISGNDTDETDCSEEEWPCNRSSTNWNNVWNCPDGRDELTDTLHFPGLSTYYCWEEEYFCLNITTGQPMCLPISRIGDKQIDCLGSSDERDFCRHAYPTSPVHRYRCLHTNTCISIFQLCDCQQDCEHNDDETIACDLLYPGKSIICNRKIFQCYDGEMVSFVSHRCEHYRHCANDEDKLFCDLIDSMIIPYDNNRNIQKRPLEIQIDRQKPNDNAVFIRWHCNRGVLVHTSDKLSNGQSHYCLCPADSYGDRCEFQRQRLTFILQPQMIGIYSESVVPNPSLFVYKIVILLFDNTFGTIIDYKQFTFVAGLYCLPKYEGSLLYPINENTMNKKQNYSVHIYAFQANGLILHTYWKLDYVPFSFLPVNRLVKRLAISVNPSDLHVSIPLSSIDNKCTCSNNSVCLRDNDSTYICVCSLGFTGRRCSIPYDACDWTDKTNECSGHGQCLLYDERLLWSQTVCVCEPGWNGDGCSSEDTSIQVSFDKAIPMPTMTTALIHAVSWDTISEPDIRIYFQRLTQNYTDSIANFSTRMPSSIIYTLDVYIQLYEHRDQFEFYVLFFRKESDTVKNNEINESRRCWPIRDLFPKSIVNAPFLRRVKYFQRPCKERNGFPLCFYDHKLMCKCNELNETVCFNMETAWTSNQCDPQMCNNRGICIQDEAECPTHSTCLCDPCALGNVCQFETRGYSLSLDAIIGTSNRRSNIIRISVILFPLFIIGGSLVNCLSIMTFFDRNTRGTGSGFYLLTSSFFSLFTLIILSFKVFFLFHPVFSQRITNINCAVIEFLLKWFTTSVEWLNVCVAIERATAIIKGTSFNRLRSKSASKWVIMGILIVLAGVSSIELIYRRVDVDNQDQRIWCVLTLNRDQNVAAHIFYATSNVLLILLPLIINFTSAIIIIVGTTRLKQNIEHKKKKPFNLVILKEELIRLKHILIGPTTLGVLAIPRLIFSFVFVCTKLNQNLLISLFGYLFGLLPTASVLFVFVLPSETYRTALYAFLERFATYCRSLIHFYRT